MIFTRPWYTRDINGRRISVFGARLHQELGRFILTLSPVNTRIPVRQAPRATLTVTPLMHNNGVRIPISPPLSPFKIAIGVTVASREGDRV